MAEPTTYVVLQRTAGELPSSGPLLWEAVDWDVQANSAEHAIRQVAPAQGRTEGTYVAVPARSWKPVTVQAVQTVTLKIEAT